jgi:hypothetical protein
MVALHVWSLTHGIADFYWNDAGEGGGDSPMSPQDLLEAGLLVYLGSLDISAERER